jgi:pimeloyl-ACP methyl ester carboxylesterase
MATLATDQSDWTDEERASARFPGARRPDRRRIVETHGLALAVSEWGDENAEPLLLAHGGFDFAGTYDGLAARLADAGYRVVCWDQRGHGDSDHAELYSWDADVRDLLDVLDSVSNEPLVVIGHSKGGAILTHLIQAMPHRVRAFVNIDGIPTHRPPPDVADHERTRLLARELSGWLDNRRSAATRVRKPGTLAELAQRRQRMNPRLPLEWLRYLATIGARKDDDGWRWKIDPVLRPGGFGPHRATWDLRRFASLPVPLLGLLATEPEPMGWGTDPSEVQPYLPKNAQVVPVEGTGHFIHIEQPDQVAGLITGFLDGLS